MSARSNTAVVSDRVSVLDGVRGLAIVAVVLHHIWLVWDEARTYDNQLAQMLLKNGNYAVSAFFVIGAFLFTRSLLMKANSPNGLHPGVETLRRYLRVTPAVGVLLLTALVVGLVEKEPTYEGQSLNETAQTTLTHTWNWYLQNHIVTGRSDFGHLWYLSAYMQSFVVVAVLVWLLHRRPGWLTGVLAALLLATFVWRANYPANDMELILWMMRTTVRIDAPLAGALAACLLPYLRPWRERGPFIAWTALAVMALMSFFTHSDPAFMGMPGNIAHLALAAFVLGCTLAPTPALMNHTLGNPVFSFLGRRSLSIYIWHYPVFSYLHEHTESWDRAVRTAVALVITIGVSWLSDRTIEHWVGILLRDPRWRLLDRGFLALVTNKPRDTAQTDQVATKRESRSVWARDVPPDEM